MKKEHGNLLLLVMAMTEEQVAFARAEAIKTLEKAGVIEKKSETEYTATDKAIKDLERYFNISFKEKPSEEPKEEGGAKNDG